MVFGNFQIKSHKFTYLEYNMTRHYEWPRVVALV